MKFTVLGSWAGDIATSTWVIAGEPAVAPVFEDLWLVRVDATDADAAASTAARMMMDDPERAFIAELSELRRRAGQPSARRIAEAAGTISPATVSKIVGATQMYQLWGTRWEQAAKVVNHLGGDVDHFRQLWEISTRASHEGAQSRAIERMKTMNIAGWRGE